MWSQYLKLPPAVYVLCLGSLINRAGTFVIPFLTLYLQEDRNLGGEFATRALGACGLGALGASVFGGHLADRIGRRTVMLMSLLGAAGVLLLFATLTSGWAILLTCVGFTLIAEMYRPAAAAMIGDLVGPWLRPHAFSLMYTSINLGFAVAAAVGGILASYSYQWLFWGDALTACAYAIIIFLFIRETLQGTRVPAPNATSPPGAAADDEAKPQSISLPEALRRIARDGTFMVFCVASLCLAIVYMQALSTFPLYLMRQGIGEATYGKLIAINGLLIVGLQLPVTSLVTRYHRGAMMVAAAVVMAVGFGLIGLSTAVWHFALTVVIWTLGEIIHAPLASAIVTDLSPVELRGRYQGIMAMCFSCALMIGAPLGGAVLSRWGGGYVWAFSFGTAMLAAALYLGVRARLAARPPDDPASNSVPTGS